MLVAEVGECVYYASTVDGGSVDSNGGVEEDEKTEEQKFEEGVGWSMAGS